MAQRKYCRQIYQGGRKRSLFWRFFKWFCFSFLILVFLSALGGISLFIYYAKDLPRPEKFMEKTFVQSTKIYDRTGTTLLYELYGEEKREIIPLSSIPDNLKNAIIVAEDENFYSHPGIDFKGIVRSILVDWRLKKLAYGGSTITQQLIRSTFLTGEKTLKRKVREIVLTLELERRYSKDQILEWYLNQIPFGPNLYGVEAVSKAYFNKSAKDVTINEAAVLAASIKAPSRLSPYGSHKDELINRKNYILTQMADDGFLDPKDLEMLKKEEIKFADPITTIKAPHFIFYVQDYLYEKYGEELLEKGGFKIYTTLDWNLQQLAEEVVAEGVAQNKKFHSYNGAMVVINPKNGEILAMVGSANWFAKPYPEGCTPGLDCLFDPKVNVATYKNGRQPGSAFKPFVYATAFEKGYDDTYIVIDEETNFGTFGGKPYIPKNYDGRFRGPVTLREALAQSLNIPAIKVLANLAGLEDSIKTAQKMGITTLTDPSRYGLSIVLGGGEVKLLDMTSAYGVFATEGLRVPSSAVLKIEDSKGYIIEENNKTPRRVLDPEVVRLISDILSDNNARAPAFGVHNPLYFENYQVAVKTGTTSDFRDGWIIGYTPSIVVGVWAGNSNNEPMKNEPAIFTSGPIWRAFMEKILPDLPKENFVKPRVKTPPQNSPSPAPIPSPNPAL